MKFIQTLWNETTITNIKAGWYSPEYHLMSWALSCLQLRSFYESVELYVDAHNAKLFVDELCLPYTKINIIGDDFRLPEKRLWALPKLYTYSRQTEPFLHVDGDVFIFEAFDEKLLQSALIAQNAEVASAYYTNMQKQLTSNLEYFPDCVRKDFCSHFPITAVNAGILGGNDLAFIKKYCKLAFSYIERNKLVLANINAGIFNVFFEQHLFYSLAAKEDKEICFLIDEIIDDNNYVGFGNFHDVPHKKTYLHLLGGYKRSALVCNQLAFRLREKYPEYYYKIIAYFKKRKMPLAIDYYHDTKDSGDENCLLSRFERLKKESFHKAPAHHIHRSDSTISPNAETASQAQNAIIAYLYRNKIGITSAMECDLRSFCEQLAETADHAFCLIGKSELYARDISSANWHSIVFSGTTGDNPKLLACAHCKQIRSKYAWSNVYNRIFYPAVSLWPDCELTTGNFNCIFVPEAIPRQWNIFEIDELDSLLFEILKKPLTKDKILESAKTMFDPEEVDSCISDYTKLIEESLIKLLLHKVIIPV